MAVAPQLQPAALSGLPTSTISAAFMQLFAEVCATPAVALLGMVADDGTSTLHVWVRLDRDDDAQEERIYRALQRYRATAPALPVDLRVVFAEQSDATFPADATVLYARPAS